MKDKDAAPSVCDAASIASAQRVEQYEIAAYGTVRTFAQRLGYQGQARRLSQTLQEEGETDKKTDESGGIVHQRGCENRRVGMDDSAVGRAAVPGGRSAPQA